MGTAAMERAAIAVATASLVLTFAFDVNIVVSPVLT